MSEQIGVQGVQAAQDALTMQFQVDWERKFHYAMSGLSWAVGRLGDDAGYAGEVHERLASPLRMVPAALGLKEEAR